MKAAEACNLPEHLIELPDTEWSIWRWFSLRGAGFPVSEVLKLATPDCAAAADRLLSLEDEANLAWQAARVALRREMDEADGEKRTRLGKAMKHLKQGKVPRLAEVTSSTAAVLGDFENACARVDAASQDYRNQFETALAGITTAVQDVVGDARFREAIIWQNRSAFHTGMDALLSASPRGDVKRDKLLRKREMLVASYCQRYSVKNDTSGFFGPVGWARFVSDGKALNLRLGDSLLAARQVYFDGWCLDALAETFNSDKALLPWMAPRRLPAEQLEGTTVHLPVHKPLLLSSDEVAVLQACDGERTAKQIAAAINENPATELRGEQNVYQVLERLQEKGVVTWKVEVPWTMRVPEEWQVELNLRRVLERIGDERLRGQSLAGVTELENARDDVARAAGHPEQLNQSLSKLESTFTRLTGAASTRAAGKMYAGRTLVYEDCRRDLEMEIGAPILAALAPPLSLLLESARWFTYQVACEFERAFADIYSSLVQREGRPAVDFVSFSNHAQPLIYGDKNSLVENIVRTMQEHWLEILSFAESERTVARQSEALRSRVRAVFAAPHSGWQYARYHSPDVMIAAESVEAIARDDYQLVMGEFHVGTNTLGNALFVSQHPRQHEIFTALDSDLDAPRLIPVPPKYRLTSRDYTLFTSPKDYRLEIVNEPSGVPRAQALPIGSLVVVRTSDNELAVQTRDGKIRFRLIEAFADALSDKVSNSFKILPPRRYLPRVSIDRVVINRQSWSFSPAELEFAAEKDEAIRYLEARRWAQQYDIPRLVFFKSDFETKPIYIDFASPLFINILAKLTRQTQKACLEAEQNPDDLLITLTEMYPTPDLAWLPDAVGQHYTSELRMVALDPMRVHRAEARCE
jgi:hypothetical protein